MSTDSVYAKLLKAYKVSCPLVTLNTSDPAQALRQIVATLPAGVPVLNWDYARGFSIPVQSGKRLDVAKSEFGLLGDPATINLTDALMAAQKTTSAVLCIQNAQWFMEKHDVVQAIWNLRDQFKNPRRMLILMGTGIRVPVELQHDVIELDEPLPTSDELQAIVGKLVDDANQAGALETTVDSSTVRDTAAASQGMSAFGAEQLTALNMSKQGLSVRGVWDDKCTKIDETPGLRVVSGGSFSDVAGVENAKQFLRSILTGEEKPNAIVFVDEIEKALGGSGSDSSGVSQDQLGVLLQWMQDKRAAGCIYVGPPGAAKSALAKKAGGEVGIPTIQMDLGGMKGSLVGESETRIRDALKVVEAVSGGNTLWLATCNSLTSLPPELRRRFKYGTWFFDLPDHTERVAIWKLYCAKFKHKAPSPALLQQEWTGAEIESCCEIAWKTKTTLDAASAYIVPVSKAAAAQIESLRTGAEGKFLSASKPGVYSRPEAANSTARRFD